MEQTRCRQSPIKGRVYPRSQADQTMLSCFDTLEVTTVQFYNVRLIDRQTVQRRDDRAQSVFVQQSLPESSL